MVFFYIYRRRKQHLLSTKLGQKQNFDAFLLLFGFIVYANSSSMIKKQNTTFLVKNLIHFLCSILGNIEIYAKLKVFKKKCTAAAKKMVLRKYFVCFSRCNLIHENNYD